MRRLDRTLHGVRGLKLSSVLQASMLVNRTLHGVRGLKHLGESTEERGRDRTLHGVRGLKLGDVPWCIA